MIDRSPQGNLFGHHRSIIKCATIVVSDAAWESAGERILAGTESDCGIKVSGSPVDVFALAGQSSGLLRRQRDTDRTGRTATARKPDTLP